MDEHELDDDPLSQLADEYLARLRQGDSVDIDEFADRFPDLAARIQRLFPTIRHLEHLQSSKTRSSDLLPRALVTRISGELLGDYRIVREIGRGGMGVVYEAIQESLGRSVALKVLDVVRDPRSWSRFQHEAQSAAKLHHTNIVSVFGVGEANGVCYYAMQLIDGQGGDSLLSKLQKQHSGGGRGGNLSFEESVNGTDAQPAVHVPSPKDSPAAYFRFVARFGVQVAEALAYAHRQGVLHRDIKPANLLLDSAQTVWVTDFGLAKSVDSAALTRSGDVVGTLRYMAPERFHGRSLPQSDVYGLGITLYEFLTCASAYAEYDRPGFVGRVLNSPLIPPRTVNPLIPRDLETIVLEATAKDPHDRFPSAKAMADDLQRFLDGRPILCRRAGRAEELWRWCRRNRLVASLAATVALLLLALTAGSLVSNASLSNALVESEHARHQAREQLWIAKRDEARSLRMSQRPGQRIDSLKAIQAAMDLPDPIGHSRGELRTEAIAALALADVETRAQWKLASSPRFVSTFDYDCTRYISGRANGTIDVRTVPDNRVLSTLGLTGTPPAPAIDTACIVSQDGRFFAGYQQASQLCRVFRLDQNPPTLVTEQSAIQVAFGPSPAELTICRPDFQVVVLNLDSGQSRELVPLNGRLANWAMNPQRQLLAVQVVENGQPRVEIRSTVDGSPFSILPMPIVATMLVWHPDGHRLATIADDRLIRLWEVNSRKQVGQFVGHQTLGIHGSFKMAGALFVSNAWDNVCRVWEVESGRPLLKFDAAGCDLLASSKDDRFVTHSVVAVDLARLQQLSISRIYRSLGWYGGNGMTHYAGGLARTVFDHDGRTMAATLHGNSVVVLDFPTARHLAEVPVGDNMPLCFDANGNLLTTGMSGLRRWKLDRRVGDDGRWGVGSPEVLDATGHLDRWGADQYGRIIAIPTGQACEEIRILHLVDRPRVIPIAERKDIRFCTVSPNGRWVASHNFGDERDGMAVWNAENGELIKRFPTESGGTCDFSPDGKWLLSSAGGCRIWSTDNWAPGPVLGGAFGCFSPDGLTYAQSGDDPGSIRLLDVNGATLRVVLDAPEHERLQPHTFSPDGRHLLAVGQESGLMHIWDLHSLDEELREIGLEGDLGTSLPPER